MWIDPITERLLTNAPNNRPVIFMYHSITTDSSRTGWPWSVSLNEFRKQMALLSRYGWTTVNIRDFASPDRLPARAVAITFDDGYKDNYKAYQVLRELGQTATWFMVGDNVGKKSTWQDPGAPVGMAMLSAAQLREMAVHGFEIGAHGLTHLHLTRLDDASLEEETVRPVQVLQNLLGGEITSFAYPYGDYDDRVIAAVKNAGYRQACTCMTGWAMKNTDQMRLRRIPVHRADTLAGFVRKLVFADNDFGWFRLAKYYLNQLGLR